MTTNLSHPCHDPWQKMNSLIPELSGINLICYYDPHKDYVIHSLINIHHKAESISGGPSPPIPCGDILQYVTFSMGVVLHYNSTMVSTSTDLVDLVYALLINSVTYAQCLSVKCLLFYLEYGV